jgi:hypothetical protein
MTVSIDDFHDDTRLLSRTQPKLVNCKIGETEAASQAENSDSLRISQRLTNVERSKRLERSEAVERLELLEPPSKKTHIGARTNGQTPSERY